jgi:hypothetical protein
MASQAQREPPVSPALPERRAPQERPAPTVDLATAKHGACVGQAGAFSGLPSSGPGTQRVARWKWPCF